MATSTKSHLGSRTRQRQDGRASDPRLGTDIQEQLGTLLQRLYGDLLREPVPDRFVEILKAYRPSEPEERS